MLNPSIQSLEPQPKRWTGPRLVLLLFLALSLTACASTNLTDSWVDPSVHTFPHFRKVLVAALNADTTLRRNAEIALMANLKRTEVVPSYAFTPDWEGGKLDQISDKLQRAGIDGVVILRLTGVDKEQAWVPGTYSSFDSYRGYPYYWCPAYYPITYDPGYIPYSIFGGYWGHAYYWCPAYYPITYDPGYIPDTIIRGETKIYTVDGGKLIYAAHSRSFNPTDITKMVKEIVASVADDLKTRGLLD